MTLQRSQAADLSLGSERRGARSLRTREKIYAAALAEFRRTGFARANVERIVAGAGVARGTFYAHFPGKEYVLHEMQRRCEVGIIARCVSGAPPGPTSARAFLERFTEAILDEFAEHEDPTLLREMLALHFLEPAQIETDSDPLLKHVAEFFRDAATAGNIRGDIPAQQLAQLFVVCVGSTLLQTSGTLEDMRAAGRDLVSVFLRGLTP
ncbi:MAG: TetR/AcrR family transcriptional regulator [Deltaproteobacteria bacterium]|nr:TetR/AcrR family transcriptional regulator [Deltaproteobacteria bacterium]